MGRRQDRAARYPNRAAISSAQLTTYVDGYGRFWLYGTVNRKELATLMAWGLDEGTAVDVIIRGRAAG